MKHMRKTVTGGGSSLGNRSKLSVLAIALTLALSALVAVPAYAASGDATEPTLWDSIVSFFTGEPAEDSADASAEISPYAAGDKGIKKSDPSTIDAWNSILQEEGQASTQNIGRIWTDKSVFTEDAKFTQGPLAGQPIDVEGDHDFLVGLSALSSTSNLSSTTHTSQPLDIVLVLDDSGSMAYSIDSDVPNQTVYTPLSADEVVESHGEINETLLGSLAEQLTRGGEYYAQIGDDYVRIYEQTTSVSGDWFTSYDEHVSWTLNGQEVNPETTQFYSRTTYNMSERRGALQYAVSNFIDQAAAMNAQITDENAKIRLSIVVFASNSSIENHLTVCEGANVDALKGTLNDLSANGATNAGAGMTSANNELRQNSNRENTKQIVIFFTDGVPTTSDSFATGVANTAVDQAGAIKDRGGSVYSIGIFDGADPSQTELGRNPNDTDRANVFMNAVSSNYPNSTAWNNLGQRATGNPDFYKSADNAGSLNEVFQDIFDESTEGATSGSPIEGTDVEGVQDAVPGTLTFTDALGDYMEVTGDNMTLVYGGQQYSATKGEDGVYRFPGQTVDGNDIYKSAKLSDITISIQKGEGSAGDTVTVSMPASFIPLRNYTVTTVDGKTEMSVTDAYPIRLFYGVSVKQDVLDNLGDPSNTTLQDYINENKTGGGSVNFYANKWSGEQFGDTTATFTPNEGNKFYYYTDNTELYIDESCNTRATRWNISGDDTLYYKDTYWVQNGTSGSEETEVLAISVNGQDAQGLEYDRNNNAYIAAGTQRYDRPAGLASNKGENTTSTATNVLNPTWSNGNTVSQRLGNNGVIPVELPAQLSVTKEVKFGDDYGTVGFDATKYTNRSYQMTIHVDGASGTYKAQVTNAQGDVVSTPTDGYFDITFSAEGNATQSLKDGEKLVIYGLDALAGFKVTEEALGNGFTTDYVQQTGQLKADGTSNVVVTNTYTLSSTTGNGSELFKGTKVLDGRDWADGDTFTFQITGQDGAPTPMPNTVTVNAANTKVEGHDAATFNFGDVTYNTPGVYKYTIVETKPATAHPGMSYSSATYEVEVTVADKGDGTMTVTPKMTQTQADNVEDTAAGELKDVNAVFTNHFSETDTTAVLGAYKDYSNNSGNANMDLTDGMFTIELRPTGGNADEAPMPANVQADEDGRFATATNANNNFDFGRITYDNMMDGKTFTYQIREVSGSVKNMHYDDAVYTVQVTVNVNDQNQVSVDTKYFDAEGASLGVSEGGQAIEPTFVNEYDPTDATLAGDAAIHGDKTLTGRDMQPDETFGFTLAPQNQAAIAGVNNDTISIAGNNWSASVSEGTNGVAKGFSFGDMTFTRAGEYTFTVKETSHNDDALPASDNVPGMTYDRDACTVTVTVTDENGALTPSVSYNNGTDQPTDRATFENTYTSSVDFGNVEGGINVTKKLTGRNMTAGEFAFSVTAVETDGSVDAKTADAKLVEADRSFTNPTGAMAGVASQAWKQLAGMTFNQDDAGKTFVYEVCETTTATDVLAVDTAVYTVSLTPHDNADGSMYVTGTVTKDGTEYASIDTRAEDYTAPTLAFENVYTPKPISTSDDADTTLQVTKQVTGAPAVEAFDFELTLDTANSDNGADGVFSNEEATQAFVSAKKSTSADIAAGATETVKFDQLTFTKAGTYTFKVKETTTSDLSYWKYDNTERTITVEVSDNDGQLEILYAQGNNPTIENTYDHGTVIIGGDTSTPVEVKKAVTGWTTDAVFNFTLAPADFDAEDPESVEHWNAVKADESAAKTGITDGFTTTDDLGVDNAKTAKFGEITFTEPGTYTFNVTEDGAADFNKQSADKRAGWTYDDSTYQIVVEVTETNADDVYDGQLHATITSDPVTFTNKYEAGTATVEGGEATFAGTKVLEGRQWLEGETYDFTMKPVEEEGVDWSSVSYKADADAEAAEVTVDSSWQAEATANGSDNASFYFDGIFTFSKAGTYSFNVTENAPADGNGMTYDRHTGLITVTVTDDGTGTLKPSVAYGTVTAGDTQNDMTFTNRYAGTPVTWGRATGELLGGHKYINDTTGNTYTLAEGQFSFTMRAQAKGNPMPEGWDGTTVDNQGRGMMTVTNGTGDASAIDVYDFGWIEFTHEDMAGATAVDGQPGVYTKSFQYNIFETGNMPAGISKDNTAYTVTFTVTEDHNTGKMTATPSAVKIVDGGDGEGTTGTEVDVAKLDFTNTYNPASIDSYMNIFKTLDGRDWLQGDTFTFNVSMTATETDGSEWPADAPLPSVDAQGSNYQISEAKENAAGNGFDYTVTINPSSATGNTYRFDTGKITYEREGIYTYTVSEADSTVKGVTADTTTYEVVVKVTDENGALKREVTRVTPPLTDHGTGDQGFAALDFTNTYVPGDVTVGANGSSSITVQKTLGRDWIDSDSFEFQITAKDNAPIPADDKVTVDAQAGTAANTAVTAVFGDITYKKSDLGTDASGKPLMEKDFVYEVKELGDDHDGLTYDDHIATVTVHVKDNGDGTMTATVSVDNTGAPSQADASNNAVAAFTNTYEAADFEGVPTNFSFIKDFEGHEWTDAYSFQFKLTPTSKNAPMPKADEAAGTVMDEDGVSLIKTVSGPQDDGDDDKNSTKVSFDFGKIGYTEAGEYTYEVTEVNAGTTAGGIEYSNVTAKITVKVTDDTTTGKLVATATVDDSTFVNKYSVEDITYDASAGLQIVKNMTGRTIADGDFAFTMEGADQKSIDRLNNGTALTFKTDGADFNADGNTSTDTIDAKTGLVFTQADDGQTYTYTMKETDGGTTADGVTYDGTTYTVKFAVTDNGNGTLSVKTTVTSSDQADQPQESTFTTEGAAAAKLQLTFDNSYDAGSVTVGASGSTKITGTKALANDDITKYNFSFSVKDAKGNEVATGSTNGTETITFSDIAYTTKSLNEAVANGVATVDRTGASGDVYTFAYTVSEADPGNGVTANTKVQGVTVKVTDNRTGQLSAEVSYDNGSMSFSNTYGADSNFPLTIVGKKVVNGAQPGLSVPTLEGGEYTFEITAPDGTPMPQSSTAKNDSDGMVYFPVNYTMENVFGTDATADATAEDGVATLTAGRYKDFTYTITEDGSIEGVSNEGGSKTVVVRVTDQGGGKITAEVISAQTEQGTDFTFTNTYNVTPESSSLTGDGGFTITKELTSNTGRTPAADEFTFQLIDKTTGKIYEAKNAADGSVSMPAVSFSAPGSYGFQLVEVAGNASGMTYDKNIYDVTATVTDNSNGTLSVAWSMPDLEGKDVTFTNDYEADPTSVSVVAGKAISGRPLVDGEFTFQILENGKVIAEATNDANGQIAFPTLSYDKTGEHDYQIVEVKGNAGGVTYDDTVYTMHVSVTDNPQAGALSAKVTYPDGDPVFSNTYVASGDTSITFGATKKLEGRDLKAGEFSFELLGPDGKVVATATNAADGSVVFDEPMSFSAAGTYTYQVREALPEDDDTNTEGIQKDGVTYDETVWTATVTVTDDYKGGLSASVSYGDGGNLPSFVNVYVEPPKIPQTGDTTNMVLPLVLAVGGVALVAGALTVAKRRSK